MKGYSGNKLGKERSLSRGCSIILSTVWERRFHPIREICCGGRKSPIRWRATKRDGSRAKLGDATRRESRCRRSPSEMVYENFIVGPRCSAVVFKVLSRRLSVAGPGESEGWRKKGLRILFFNRVKRDGEREREKEGTPGFIKVVWHICSRRLLPSSARTDNTDNGSYNVLFYLLFHLKRARVFSFSSKD